MINPLLYEYKDRHKGRSAALLGNGPTFLKYEPKNIITIGCNQHIRCKDLNLDYYFIGDGEDKRKGYNREPKAYHDYFKNHEKNFVRINGGTPNTERCASVERGLSGCVYYHVNKVFNEAKDLSNNPHNTMAVGASITFEMLQFILFTGISNLYLIGQDCTIDKGSFYRSVTRVPNKADSLKIANHFWKEARLFIEDKYPNVTVRTINPVRMTQFPECTYNEIIENT